MTKKWIPIFVKSKEGTSNSYKDNEKVEVDTGKSKIAVMLRIIAWTIGIIAMLVGFFLAVDKEKIIFLISAVAGATLEMLSFYALASILDYLAELTSIIRSGFKYNESDK